MPAADPHADPLDATATAAPTPGTAVPAARAYPAAIGRFSVDRQIGEGGMGVVLLATDATLGRQVALKLLRTEADDRIGKQRFLREAQAAARLVHENVVVVHEVGEHAGQAYVAMEYVSGGTLKTWQAAKRRPYEEIVAMYVRAGRGLEAAHAAGLVHRDFKPDNVLIGTDGRVRVTDFGLVAVEGAADSGERGHEPADPRLTRTGARMGTPRYMAPEQHRGAPVDARADQFAFCAALYEALYQRAPFPGDTYAEIFAAIERGEAVPPPAGAASQIPTYIRAAIERGLRRTRAERYPAMTELLAALAAPRRRARWPLYAIGILVGAAVGGGASIEIAAHREATINRERAVQLEAELARLRQKSRAGSDREVLVKQIQNLEQELERIDDKDADGSDPPDPPEAPDPTN